MKRLLAALFFAPFVVWDMTWLWGTGTTFWIVFTPTALSVPFFMKAARND